MYQRQRPVVEDITSLPEGPRLPDGSVGTSDRRSMVDTGRDQHMALIVLCSHGATTSKIAPLRN
jgi:hypothetical protein